MEPDVTTPVIPMGKFKGRPIAEMATPFLMWLLSQDAIRFKHRDLVPQCLGVLRSRFADFEKLVGELEPKAKPPEYWKLKPNAKTKRQRKVQPCPPQVRPPKDLDARAARLLALQSELARRRQIAPNDGSDLV